MRSLLKLLAGLVLLLVAAVIGMSLWMLYPYPQDQALIDPALRSDDRVRVTEGEFLVFQPGSGTPDTGLVFYPGGKVDPAAYAPILREIAATGVAVVVTPMPLKAAFLGVERASEAMSAFPEVNTWYLAGHSLGGVAASLYAEQDGDKLAGLIFWASYPVADLSDLDLEVLSIYATGDVQTTLEEIEQSRPLLPEKAHLVEIEGNHWQFGHFSSSLHMQSPAVSREAQQAQVVITTLEFMR